MALSRFAFWACIGECNPAGSYPSPPPSLHHLTPVTSFPIQLDRTKQTSADKFEIIAEGEGSDDVPRDESNLVVTGMKAAFAAAGKPMPTLKYHCINRIPYARCVCVWMDCWALNPHVCAWGRGDL